MQYKPELHFGVPAADQILINRFYTVGYSYYFRQAKWALEVVEGTEHTIDLPDVGRAETFRPDYRIPKQFRVDLDVYTGTGYDRGHLVASANQDDSDLQNSETYLLSNMSPQKAGFNRGIWKDLEDQIRKLNDQAKVACTYVICGPIFDLEVQTQWLKDDSGSIPVPSHFFKSVLAEYKTGRIEVWAFEFENKVHNDQIKDHQTTVAYIEQRSGVELWNSLLGSKIQNKKGKKKKLWFKQ